MLGGYAQLGRASFLKKSVTGLCSHNEVWLAFNIVAIDGWNGQDAIVYADGVEVWRRPFSFSGASSCGGNGAEGSISGTIVLSHSARTLALELRTTLHAEADTVSWGLESFTVYADCAGESEAACEPIVAASCVPVLVSGKPRSLPCFAATFCLPASPSFPISLSSSLPRPECSLIIVSCVLSASRERCRSFRTDWVSHITLMQA